MSIHLSQVDRTPTIKEETVPQFENGDNGKVGLEARKGESMINDRKDLKF